MGFDAMAAPVQAGPCRLFIGKRSDPFFADADGVLHWLLDGATGNFEWTGPYEDLTAVFPFLGMPHP